MALAPGMRVGAYEIESLFGVGGMGEVYRARDPRLKRKVAIKVLPEGFAKDADRMNRFDFEAQAVGRLNHPNVVAIYDVGIHDGSPYVVSELFEGESLRDSLHGRRICSSPRRVASRSWISGSPKRPPLQATWTEPASSRRLLARFSAPYRTCLPGRSEDRGSITGPTSSVLVACCTKRAGVGRTGLNLLMTANGKNYLYVTRRNLAELYLVSGLK